MSGSADLATHTAVAEALAWVAETAAVWITATLTATRSRSAAAPPRDRASIQSSVVPAVSRALVSCPFPVMETNCTRAPMRQAALTKARVTPESTTRSPGFCATSNGQVMPLTLGLFSRAIRARGWRLPKLRRAGRGAAIGPPLRCRAEACCRVRCNCFAPAGLIIPCFYSWPRRRQRRAIDRDQL